MYERVYAYNPRQLAAKYPLALVTGRPRRPDAETALRCAAAPPRCPEQGGCDVQRRGLRGGGGGRAPSLPSGVRSRDGARQAGQR